MSGEDDVLISWRDCNCEWATKFCDEEHVKYAVVSRERLLTLLDVDA